MASFRNSNSQSHEGKTQGPFLTFAEAYALHKAKEAAAKHRKDDNQTLVSNIEELHNIMRQIKYDIENGPQLKQIKNMLKAIPPYFGQHISEWCDEDNFNILQLAIIYDRPSLVQFLLVETNLFPPRHTPPSNPYAHLAAVAGHVDCLRAILQYRPGSFFAADQPRHAIRLPDHILRKLKPGEKPGTRKTPNRLMQKIKMTTKAAEKKLQQTRSADSYDVTALLDKDMGDVDKGFKIKRKKINVNAVRREPCRKASSLSKKDRTSTLGGGEAASSKKDVTPESKAISKNLLLAAPVLCSRQSIAKWPDLSKLMPIKKIHKPVNDRNHFTRRLGHNSGEHLITVFWDIESHFGEGVVQGAGSKIKIQYAPDSQIKEQLLEVRIRPTDSNNMVRWPTSTVSRKSSRETIKPKPPTTTSVVTPTNILTRVSLKKTSVKSIDYGVRGTKGYKEFELKLPSHEKSEKEDSDSYMGKTPLTFAAEKGFGDCVQLILDMVVVRRNPTIAPTDPLTLATKARSPETIILLIEKAFSREDFQGAVLLSIREMLPDCLTALLSKGKTRNALFDGVNLFHILYSQCVISGTRYELMPEMTQTLISCKEDVNAHNIPTTYPMYTLINCAFNIHTGKQIFFFIECLNILLENKANPHYDEEKQVKAQVRPTLAFSRKAFTSAIHCIFGSAKNSVNYFEKTYWSKLFMKKFVTTIEMFDRTPRRVLNHVLFEYMDAVCELGLDRTIVRCLLLYGANPDGIMDGKYAINIYFDNMLPFMTKFEIINSYDHFLQELDTLMVICRSMSLKHLRHAMTIFLQEHLLTAPIQSLPITRQFAASLDHMVRNPRPLTESVAKATWIFLKRNKTKLETLNLAYDYVHLILP
ncbi:hypothetical protein EGW08_019268 [Elysia chlorotica]|uniref:Uncharacterized protein n=1 Tax=Elysia chlorotica TaxID=188477 RepID=A0A433SUK2_ELYCH|nr:hypothetical protein EGW08_019268 [Elysia chlorotica]